MRSALDGIGVAEPQLDDVDLLLDDGCRVDRALQKCTGGQPAAARLVAREGRPIGEQHRDARRGEVVRGGGAGRATSDHENVEALHRP